MYSSVGVIKEDLKETERLLDLLEGGRLKKRIDPKTADKLEQKIRLKAMLSADQITLKRYNQQMTTNVAFLNVYIFSYMTAMGALNMQLDQKTKDIIARMREDDDGPESQRHRTMEDVANLAINSQIQLILPPDGAGNSIGGGPHREAVRGRGRGRGRGQGRGRGRGRGRPARRAQHVGALQENGRLLCRSCQKTYVQGRFPG